MEHLLKNVEMTANSGFGRHNIQQYIYTQKCKFLLSSKKGNVFYFVFLPTHPKNRTKPQIWYGFRTDLDQLCLWSSCNYFWLNVYQIVILENLVEIWWILLRFWRIWVEKLLWYILKLTWLCIPKEPLKVDLIARSN